MHSQPPVLVFSHLRWDFVWQRPQHLLTRVARNHRVLFIEEPLRHESADPAWECQTPAPGILVCRPRTPLAAPGFHDEQMPALEGLVADLLRREGLDDYLAWFYTPMAVPLLRGLRPRAVVYDCMDELSAFRGAPPELLRREAELLGRADIVFTGGPSLYRAKNDRHPNVHCFPSSVDAAHFGKARQGLAEPAEQAALPHPRLGFFSVIDERFDVPLLDALARARPDWQFVLVGPVAKIDPADLPQRPNLHYPGKRPYEALPGYLKAWDVCLMPFALNEATRYTSPTKTLEYLAADKPIVSTSVPDVVAGYRGVVHFADDLAAFVAAIEAALAEAPNDPETRFKRRLVARALYSTWLDVEELKTAAVH